MKKCVKLVISKNLQRDARSTKYKFIPLPFYPQQISQGLGLNPGHCTDRLATNRLSHGTVLIRVAN